MTLRKIVSAAMVGNALEWYSFILFIFFFTEISEVFFPPNDPHLVAVLKTFGLFALGFLARPLGGLLLGYYGDHYGRRLIFIFSSVSLTLSTFCIGILPGYATIGSMAAILLALLRLVEGFCISAELTNSTALLIEHCETKYHGFVGSLLITSSSIGICIAALVSFMLHHYLSPAELVSYGWRIPFISSIVWGIFSIYLRYNVLESPAFIKTKPLALREHWRAVWNYRSAIIKIILMVATPATANYFISGYFIVFLEACEHYSVETLMLFAFIGNALTILFYPLIGYFANGWDNIKLIKLGLYLTIALSIVVFYLLHYPNLYSALIGQLLFVVITSPLTTLTTVVILEDLPIELRTTISSFSYNVSMAIFGGSATFISLLLTKLTDSIYAPAFYLMALCVIALLITFRQEQHTKV